MRVYLHKPERDTVEENLASAISLIDTDPALLKKAERSKNDAFFTINATEAGDAAAYCYALDRPRKEVFGYMQTAVARWIGALGVGVRLYPAQYVQALSMALATDDAKSVALLAAQGRDKYTNPAVQMTEVAYALAELLADLAGGTKTASKRADALKAAIAARGKQASPNVQDLAAPIALAVAAGDSAALQSAGDAHAAGYAKIFKKSALRHRSDAFLDVWGLGFLCLAHARDLTLPTGNVYLGGPLLTD